jgi:hypothetical protein
MSLRQVTEKIDSGCALQPKQGKGGTHKEQGFRFLACWERMPPSEFPSHLMTSHGTLYAMNSGWSARNQSARSAADAAAAFEIFA